ncbi:MAG: epimerase, partial [Anaerolineae bacterium]|nr:epimerase [Anaerolineae bacterium]
AQYVWVSGDFLSEQQVAPWSELPLWLPETEWATTDIRRALAVGLTFRALAETARDTLRWTEQQPAPGAPRAGLTAEREAELLAAWAQR